MRVCSLCAQYDLCKRIKATLKNERYSWRASRSGGKVACHDHTRNSRQEEDSCSDSDNFVLQPPSKEYLVYMTAGIWVCFVNRKVERGHKKRGSGRKSKETKAGSVYHKSICLIDEVNSIKFIENHLENSELIRLSPLFASWPLFIIFFNYQRFMLLNVKSK